MDCKISHYYQLFKTGGQTDMQNLLDIATPMAKVGPAHPPSLCFFGSMLNSGGFFICPAEAL